VHQWIARRWSTFITSANSATALILSVGIGWRLGIRPGVEWIVTTGLAVIVLAVSAAVAWREYILDD
jgi:hypothetical protein